MAGCFSSSSFNEAAGIPRGRRRCRRAIGFSGTTEASMRPRVFPAEDPRHRRPTTSPSCCFNEAAGIPRGRRRTVADGYSTEHRFNEAAGIPRGRRSIRWPRCRRRTRFNEAAGIPRGRPSRTTSRSSRPSCFNEAAGIPRGRPSGRPSEYRRLLVASMRPRVFPAEDDEGADPAEHRGAASMRPRVFPAEDGGDFARGEVPNPELQ